MSNQFKPVGRVLCGMPRLISLKTLYVDTAPVRGEIPDIEPEQIHLGRLKRAGWLEQTAESVLDYGKAVNIKTKRGRH
ncbi:hypothetical protein WDV93_21140 [Pantoea ananatis]